MLRKQTWLGLAAAAIVMTVAPASWAQAANSNVGTVTINATLTESLTVTINSGAAVTIPLLANTAANTNVAGAAYVPIQPQSSQAQATSGRYDNTPIGAIVLLVLGFVFLLNTFNLLRVARLWPLVMIGLGLWLAYKRTSQQA